MLHRAPFRSRPGSVPRRRPGSRRSGAGASTAALVVGAALVLGGCGSGGTEFGGGGGGLPATAAPTTAATVPVESRPVRVAAAPWTLATAVQREGLVTDGTAIYLVGGLDRASVSSASVLRLDPRTGAASVVATLPLAVHDTQAVWRSGTIVVVGGGSPPIRPDVQSVVPGGAAKVIGALPGERADHVVALLDGTIYALGGVDQGSALVGSVVASTDGGATWKVRGTLAQAVRYPAVGVWDGQVYVVGGVATTSGTDTTAIQRFDPATDRTTVVGQLPQALSHPTTVQFGPVLVLAGGFVGNARTARVQRLDLRTLVTTDTGQSLPAPMSDGGGVVVGDTGYLVGGEGSDGKASTTVTLVTLG